MQIFLAVSFLLLPTVYFGIRQYRDYSTNLSGTIKSITPFSWFAISTLIVYVAWSIYTDAKPVLNPNLIASVKFHIFLKAYIIPGLGYALIIFPSPACEALGIYKLFKTLGEQKLLSKSLGVIILAYCYILVFQGYSALANN